MIFATPQAIVHVGSAVRAVTYSEDFIIGPAPGVIGLVDVAGMQSPAIASAPAIAGYVVDALSRLGYIPNPD
jgi:glycerol-3-phosphate dehydrogenase